MERSVSQGKPKYSDETISLNNWFSNTVLMQEHEITKMQKLGIPMFSQAHRDVVVPSRACREIFSSTLCIEYKNTQAHESERSHWI